MGTDAGWKGTVLFLMQTPLAPRHQVLSVYDRELLALIFVVQEWSHFLFGYHLVVRTD